MILYSHRGNIKGSDSKNENAPDYIDKAISLGYHVEIDIKIINKDLYLGHDYPQYLCQKEWIDERKEKLLIHVKDFEVLKFIKQKKIDWHYFCHNNDNFTFTSKNKIWVHDLSLKTDNNCIIPLISKYNVISYKQKKLYGLCSDYIELCKERFNPI